MLNYVVRYFNNDPPAMNLNADTLSSLLFALCKAVNNMDRRIC